jgi:hypothetical protein
MANVGDCDQAGAMGFTSNLDEYCRDCERGLRFNQRWLRVSRAKNPGKILEVQFFPVHVADKILKASPLCPRSLPLGLIILAQLHFLE